MDIVKALNILQDMIERQNLPNDDFRVLAYDTVAMFVIYKRKKQIESLDRPLKLYILAVSTYIENYNTSIKNPLPVKELHKYLDKPIHFHIAQFCSKLNSKEQSRFFEDLGICKSHPALTETEIKKESTNKLLEAIKNPNNKKIIFNEAWNESDVNEIITNQFLNYYNQIDTKLEPKKTIE